MLTLRLLGSLDVQLNGQPRRGAGRDKGLILLAYLAAGAGRAHTREDIADLFWPELPYERALHNLRQTLLRLRRLLDADAACLACSKHSIAFEPPADGWIDLQPFLSPLGEDESTERLQQRAALYRGEFMADLSLEISERFEAWVAQLRAQCLTAALALEGRLAARHEQAGHIEQAIAHAQRGAALDPWDEDGQQRLLRLLARAGLAPAALHHFSAWQAQLRAELGVEAGAALRALVETIRREAQADACAARSPPAPSERRQITVLDCGLDCDFDYADDDPETLAETLRGPSAWVAAVLLRHGGRITTQQPNHLSAFFGWPAADERAAAHAAQAALELLDGLRAAHPRVRLAIGIDSAPMLVGDDDSGGWLAVERALRLRLHADAGVILLGARPAAALAPTYDLAPAPGADPNAGAWRLLGVRRCTPIGQMETCRFVGRKAELARMKRIARAARAGGSRLLALSGAAGIGKSRLLREFLRANRIEPADVYWCECDPLHVDSPLFALLQLLRRALDLSPQASAGQVHARLWAALPAGRRELLVHRLLPLFGGGAAGVEARSAWIGALGELLAQLLAREGGYAVLIIEDAHWLDASSLEVLDALRARLPEGLLILLTARACPPLAGMETLPLAPLDRAASEALGAQLLPRAEVDVRAVAQAGEGVPLFIIELARVQAAAGAAQAVPGSLQDLLAARLHQAGKDQPLLQAAAVIGRTFRADTLRALDGELGGALQATLDRLIGLGLLERAGNHLRFCHGLLARAAYNSLPRARRIGLHHRYADQLQSDASTCAQAPEEIAWHLCAAERIAQSAPWWLRAAQRASRLPAYAETVQFAERALAALAADPARADHVEIELGSLLIGAYAHVALGGYFDPAAQRLYRRARALLRRQTNPQQAFGVLRGYWLGASSRASHREARLIAEEMTGIAAAAGLDALHGIARYLVGNSALWLGEFQDALFHLQAAVELLGEGIVLHDPLLAHEQDFAATAAGYLGWAYWYLGDDAQALRHGRRALELARSRGHLLTQLHVATSFCTIALGCGLEQEVIRLTAQSTAQAEAAGLAMWGDIAALQAGCARSALGEAVDCAETARRLACLCAIYPGGAAGFQVMAAEIFIAQGDLARAQATLLDLRRSLRSTEAGVFAVSRLLLESRLLQRQGRLLRATAAARRALGCAQAQGSPVLEAEARQALCTLCSPSAGR